MFRDTVKKLQFGAQQPYGNWVYSQILINSMFTLSDLSEAHRHLESGKVQGKVAIEVV